MAWLYIPAETGERIETICNQHYNPGRRASHDPIIPPEMRNSEYLFSMLRHTFHTYHTCGPTAAMIW